MPVCTTPQHAESISASSAALITQAEVLVGATYLLARWACDVPEVEVKLALATDVHWTARSVELLRSRLGELGTEFAHARPDELPATAAFVALHELEDTAQRAYGWWAVVKPELVAGLRALRAMVDAVADGPTAVTLDDVLVALQRVTWDDAFDALGNAGVATDEEHLARKWARSHRQAVDAVLAIAEPVEPGRDGRFNVVESAPPPPVGAIEQNGQYLHALLMSIEVPTLEHCGRLILQGAGDLPWAFVLDMARQSWDEARHAALCLNRMHELGVLPGDLPIDTQLWRMTSGLSLVMRLAAHQKVGEWLGVDGAIYNGDVVRAAGDQETAHLFDFIVQDELSHVAFGNQWIKWILGSDDAVAGVTEEVLAHRAAFGATVNGGPGLPFNEWACERAGMTARDVSQLVSARLGGSAPAVSNRTD